jgi:putative phosphoesterase
MMVAMRIAVLSDVHANLTALDAVIGDIRTQAPDLVVFGGDLVGMGSRPAEVIDRVRDLGWPAIQGNTDEALWNDAQVEAFFSALPQLHGVHVMAKRANAWTRDRIGDSRLAWLRALPLAWSDGRITVVHASPGDAWRSPTREASDDEMLAAYGQLGTRTVVYGHIHFSFVRQLTSLTVVNSGSVSLSFDGDRRAAYAIIDERGAAIRRVEYDVEEEIRALAARECPDSGWLISTLRAARSQPV